MVKYKLKPETDGTFTSRTYKDDRIEELYDFHVDSNERVRKDLEPLREERPVRPQIVVKSTASPRLENQVIQPLKLLGSEVIGSLFDRVEFLKKRIQEINDSLSLREKIHNSMIAEIDEDVRDKDSMTSRAADLDEKRGLKMDISVLRKEKRLEQVQYWRDVVELKEEFRELIEKYETEKKIVDIFKEVGQSSEGA